MGLNKNDDSVKNLFTFNSVEKQLKEEQQKKTEAPQQAPIKDKVIAKDTTTEIKNYTSHTQKTTDARLKAENTRTSLVITKRHLQILTALSSYTNIKKVDVLTQLLDKGLEELKRTQPTLTDEAIKQYNSINKSLF